MLRWSLKLANNNPQLAEDLVQDAFVHFTTARPDLSAIHNVDGYLYMMLRNRHLSHVRRMARGPIEWLALIDYDSAEFGIRSIDARALAQVKEELCLICCYACTRKESSKSASVLLLRFFHGYYPSEIARVMKGTRQAVDAWIKVARNEVKLHLKDPSGLRLRKKADVTRYPRPDTSAGTVEFINELREFIFDSCNGHCLSADEIKEIYRDDSSVSVNCATLAHIASCADCLAAISGALGMPPPSDRYPTDSVGPESPVSRAGGNEHARSARQRAIHGLANAHRTARSIYEHSPKKLYVSINGFVVGSQNVNSIINELTLSINIDERIAFVEVFSEQGFLLASMDVEPPPDGEVEHSAGVEMAGGRIIDLNLTFLGNWPSLTVAYRDPLFQDSVLPVEDEAPAGPVPAEIGFAPSPAKPSRSILASLVSAISRLTDPRLLLRPGAITVAISLVLIGIILLRSFTPTTSAAELLARSIASEQILIGSPEVATRRMLSLEVHSLYTGRLLSKHRIESWQHNVNNGDRVIARRVYDESDRVVAGEWRLPDGSGAIYRQGAGLAKEPAVPATDVLNEPWRLEPTAGVFQTIVGPEASLILEEHSAQYVVRCPEASGDSSGLVSAAITLRRPDLHAIGQTLVIDRGSDRIEYSFAEIDFAQRPTHEVPESIFEPDQAHAAQSVTGLSGGGTAPAKIEQESGTAVASADLEVEITYLLNNVKANLGEQIEVERTAQGKLVVQGIVDTSERKSEILKALAPVTSNPAIRIDILTVEEASRRRTETGQASVRRFGISETSTIPVDADLRGHFATRGVAAERLDDEVRAFSERALNTSRQALRHAWALKRVSEQFTTEALGGLSSDARSKRQAIIREHARSIEQQTQALRLLLQPIFGAGSKPPGSIDAIEIGNDGDLIRAISRLAGMAHENDEAVRSAFTVSAASAGSGSIKAREFWSSLIAVEKLAAAIKTK